MFRDSHEGLPWRERNVQIEADRILHSALPELDGERDQVVVVHPDDIIGAQHRFQPNHRPLCSRTTSASATATPPACGALRRSTTLLETKTTRRMLGSALPTGAPDVRGYPDPVWNGQTG